MEIMVAAALAAILSASDKFFSVPAHATVEPERDVNGAMDNDGDNKKPASSARVRGGSI